MTDSLVVLGALVARGFLVLAAVIVLAGPSVAYECDLDSPAVNVRDFGAVGNGAADDTASLQQAAACVATKLNSGLSNAAELYFPSGLYLVRAPLVLAAKGDAGSKLTVRGDGSGASRIVIDQPLEIVDVRLAGRASEVEVSGLGFFTSKAATGGTAIRVVAPSGPPIDNQRSLVVRNVTIGSLAATAEGSVDYFDYGIDSSGLNRPLVDNVFMGNTHGPFAAREPKGRACYRLADSYAPAVRRSTCWKSNVGADISLSASGSDTFSVENVLFVGVDVGVRVSASASVNGGRIVDSHSNFYSTAADVTNVRSLHVSGNLFYVMRPSAGYPDNNPRDIVLSKCADAKINGNIFHAPGNNLSPADVKRVAVTIGEGSDKAQVEDNVFNRLGTAVKITAGVRNTAVLDNHFSVEKEAVVNQGTDTVTRRLP